VGNPVEILRSRLPSRLGLILAVGMGLLAAPGPGIAAPAGAPDATGVEAVAKALTEQIDAALAEPFLANASIGVSVVDLADNTVLYRRGDDKPLNPASNVKLVTTAAALALLGPEHRYATSLYHKDDAIKGAVLQGDVYLRGSGDPHLVTENLYLLAGNLRALGVKKITGGVVVDASHFDRDELPPGFDQKDELAAYRAPSGATAVNFNTFVVRVRPGSAVDQKPPAMVDPPVAGIEVINEAKTIDGGRTQLGVAIEDDGKKTIVRMTGTMGLTAGPVAYRYPVSAPSRYAGEVLAVALAHQGITLGRSKVKTGTVPKKARVVATHHSPPVSVLVRSVNKFSNNFMAEQILKTLADPSSPATFSAALGRVRQWLATHGMTSQELRLGNGSGLYDTNRLTTAQLTTLLGIVHRDFRISSDYLASLAVMGADGTTRRRLRDTDVSRWVRAKTGTLDGVSALSGYAGADGRKPIAFSIVFNDLRRGDAARARAVQNRIAELLARHAAGQPLVTAG
jgi:serine-type D-Ala-D-Ala carboxypeptidase/endopeptidase (penicillin-binding protein 4)